MSPAPLFMVLRPGDELGCDAMLEFAVHTVMYPEADFFYCDVRRVNNATGKVDAFFKPDWSPDLLHSQNYIGRGWCANGALIRARRRSSQRACRFGKLSFGAPPNRTRPCNPARLRYATSRNPAYAETAASERAALGKSSLASRD